MPKTFRVILCVSVDSFHGVTQLEPESGWDNPLLRYHVQFYCNNCNLAMMDRHSRPLTLSAVSMTVGGDGNEYHKPLTCPVCMECGGLRILNRGGEPIAGDGQEMPVMEMELVGNFGAYKFIESFNFRWICRKDDGSGDSVGPFYVEQDGSYAVWDSGDEELLQIQGLKGYFLVKPWEEEVDKLWIQEASRLYQDSDLEDADADSDD